MIAHFIQNGIINPQDIPALEETCQKSGHNLVFIDASFVFPTSDDDIYQNFEECHLPDARFFDIKQVANPNSDLPHMLPSPDIFERALRTLGVCQNDIILIYGQHGMIMGPARLWWMLKGFGHDNVLVLDGGLPAWRKANMPTESGAQNVHASGDFKAHRFDPACVASLETVKEISLSQKHPVLDARPEKRFTGDSPEPRQGMRSGHIPNSSNLPCSALVNKNGQFKSKEELYTLFEQLGVSLTGDTQPKTIITSCGSGVTACALALALYHLGYWPVTVYDGSWSEWGQEAAPTNAATG